MCLWAQSGLGFRSVRLDRRRVRLGCFVGMEGCLSEGAGGMAKRGLVAILRLLLHLAGSDQGQAQEWNSG